MYLAELKGKLALSDEKKEDVLTSNVFSFFKYSPRCVFLKTYLHRLRIEVTDEEANLAEFLFWPRFADNTEPDLVIIVGNHYLLFEAKYFSNFGQETEAAKAQLVREIEGGILEAKNYVKQFSLIAITADHYCKPWKFKSIPDILKQHLQWTNWQAVSHLLYDALEGGWKVTSEERDFAQDLYNLLDKKNLRDFLGTHLIYRKNPQFVKVASVFFKAKTARFRGAFIGFLASLSGPKMTCPLQKTIFFGPSKVLFGTLAASPALQSHEVIFWRRENRADE